MEPRPGETLRERLAWIFEWYRGMVSPDTGRLIYVHDPDTGEVELDGNPIRDIASVWDLEELGRFLGRDELVPVAERSLRHYLGWLADRDGALVLASERLGEPSGIAHSAFLILGLLDSDLPVRAATVSGLAEAILRQQRSDGSFRVHFGPEPDVGLEFYPPEAMLALLRTAETFPDPRLPAAVARGFRHDRARLAADQVEDELLVFYANWVAQYGLPLHATADEALRREVRDYVFALHDRVVAAGFYDDLVRSPSRQATVEVACALEGVGDALALARREGDGRRAETYERCARLASGWLRGTQCAGDCDARERGGFGDSRLHRRQRIDVTGHALGGWIRCVRLGVDT